MPACVGRPVHRAKSAACWRCACCNKNVCSFLIKIAAIFARQSSPFLVCSALSPEQQLLGMVGPAYLCRKGVFLSP